LVEDLLAEAWLKGDLASQINSLDETRDKLVKVRDDLRLKDQQEWSVK
jgi:hypothetical protein